MNQAQVLLICFAIMQAGSTNLISFYMKYFKKKAELVITTSIGETECAQELSILGTDLIQGEKWALQMLDASAKLQPGLLSGNLHQIGNFDQCLKIRENKNTSVIKGQYCTVLLLPSTQFKSEFDLMVESTFLSEAKVRLHRQDVINKLKVTYGVCIPKSCSISHLQAVWDYLEHTFKLKVHAVFADLFCTYEGKPVEPYAMDKYVYAFFGLVLLIVLVSTLYDLLIHQNSKENKKDNIWIAFSFYTNTKTLLRANINSDVEGYITCLNGVKVISIFWVILAHRFGMNIIEANINQLYVFEWGKNMESTLIFGGTFAVDTFLALSGLLLSFGYLKVTIEKGITMKILPFYANRLIRLSAPLLATVLFYCSILKNLNNGPAWPYLARMVSASCATNGWATLLFMTNFIHPDNQCLHHSWYLAVDSQLYFLSPIVLLNIARFPYRTTASVVLLGIISALNTFKISVNNSYGALYYGIDNDFLEHIYFPTFVRMTPWLVGLISGYLIFMYRSLHIPKVLNFILWTVCLLVMVFIILSHLLFTRNDYDAIISALFNSFARPLWGLAVSSIVFLCATGNGGIINKFLSMWIFNILVKLTYCVYLVHLAVIIYLEGGRRTYNHFSNFSGLHDFCGDLVLTLIAATALYLSFEAPFAKIAKIFYKKRRNETEALSKGQKHETLLKGKRFRKKRNYVLSVYSYDNDSCDSASIIEENVKKAHRQ